MHSSIHKYGASDQQFMSLHWPGVEGTIHGTVALVHGGYWRKAFTAELMVPIAADLVARGWAVANVEYRRVGHAKTPAAIVDDVAQALRCVRRWSEEAGTPGAVVGIGHSVGAQLALLNSEPLDGLVALAPVTDLPRARTENLGEGAVNEFIGEDAEDAPRLREKFSPLHQLPLQKPLLVVHGVNDQRVPIEHSTEYCVKAKGLSDTVDFWQMPQLDHLQAIDPTGTHWHQAVEWIRALP
ncbi:alpha/beta hydrolase [Arthrobacter ginkgonis]|uniref:Alpha/beta hydrolase n=1 Tax=Arthrobacter ginkgonis TaxID=1630594 RepID=A0ABP7D4W5_9MICC